MNHRPDLANAPVHAVPHWVARRTAAGGRLQWEIDPAASHTCLPADWCAAQGLDPAQLTTLWIKDDAQAPTLPAGCHAVINRAQTRLRPGTLQVVDILGECFIFRLQPQPDGELRLEQDHPDKTRYPDWAVEAAFPDVLRVLGSVCGVMDTEGHVSALPAPHPF